jgi:hypothetical protein
MAISYLKTEAHKCRQLIEFIWTFTNIYFVRPVGSKRTDIEAEIGDDGVCVVLQLVLQGQRGEPRHGRSMNLQRQNGRKHLKVIAPEIAVIKSQKKISGLTPNVNQINLETSVTNCHNYAYKTAVF